jgi:iron complex outermembrane recepter protein
VYGFEATLDASPLRVLDLGGTLTWTEGENDANEDDVYVALNSFRIQPLKATAYVEARPRQGWTSRLQVLYSGTRTRAYDERVNPNVVGFGEAKVESYAVVDLVNSLPLGPGTLRLGVNNLLNRQYFPVVSQLMWNGRNSSRAAAPGATFVVGYAVTY